MLKRIKKKDVKRNLIWYSFIIIPIITLIVLVYIPSIRTVYYSTTNMGTFGTDYNFIGLANYKLLLTSSSFLKALWNTFILAILGLLTIPLGFLLANAINSLGKSKFQSFFRVGFYLPNIITGVSVVIIFQYVLKGDGGLLNSFLSWITGRNITIGWLSNPSFSRIGATLIWLWMNLGYSMLMNLASLQSVPTDLYDACAMDGASAIQKIIYITVPLMKNCFAFLLVTGIINGFARFTDLYILGGNTCAGRPNGTLQTLIMYIYQYSFESPRYGIASAGAVILFVIVMIFTFINIRMSGFLDDEGD